MRRKNKFRKFINDIHLWLGLIAGIILFTVCLSGTIYVFRGDIEYLANPDKYNVANYNGKQPTKSIEELITHLEKAEKGKISSIEIPADPSKNYMLGLSKKSSDEKKKKKEQNKEGAKKEGENTGKKDESPKRSRPTTYYIDPYTGQINGKDGDKASEFFLIMMKLHRFLLLEPNIGRPIVGISTIVFIVLSTSGLILWFPKKLKYWKRWNHWKPGFKINLKSNWKRINHDLHNTLGFYSLILLLIMAITGLCWSFEWYKNGVSNLMGSEVFAGRNEKPVKINKSESSTISWEEIEKITNKELPYQGNIKINLPKDSTSAISVTKNKVGFFALAASDKLMINPYTGKIVSKDLFSNKPLNVQIVSLIRPLHLGDVFGTFSKIIYFITCLIGTTLPVTGVIVWINKMKKTK